MPGRLDMRQAIHPTRLPIGLPSNRRRRPLPPLLIGARISTLKTQPAQVNRDRQDGDRGKQAE